MKRLTLEYYGLDIREDGVPWNKSLNKGEIFSIFESSIYETIEKIRLPWTTLFMVSFIWTPGIGSNDIAGRIRAEVLYHKEDFISYIDTQTEWREYVSSVQQLRRVSIYWAGGVKISIKSPFRDMMRYKINDIKGEWSVILGYEGNIAGHVREWGSYEEGVKAFSIHGWEVKADEDIAKSLGYIVTIDPRYTYLEFLHVPKEKLEVQ